MAMTLTEAAKLSTDVLKVGVIENIVKDSPVLQKLPFIDIVGNSLKYNRENALPSVAFYAVGDTWAESTPTLTQLTATLSILGGDADVDAFLQATRSNYQDLTAAVLELKAKALRHKFEDTFIYGDTTGDANAFDGLRKKIGTASANSQCVTMGGTGATLTLEKVDELIDCVKGTKPDLLLMSRRSRRKMATLMRALGSMDIRQDEFGRSVEHFNGIPIAINDWILDTHTLVSGYETATTGSTCSVIYALAFGEDAICGLQSPQGVVIEEVGKLQTKDAMRHRIKWYCSLADFALVKRAALIGVQD